MPSLIELSTGNANIPLSNLTLYKDEKSRNDLEQ